MKPKIIPILICIYIISYFTLSPHLYAHSCEITILCYHQVVPQAKNLYEVSCETFKEHLRIIRSSGYQVINSQRVIELLSNIDTLASNSAQKYVVITFDDGYKSVYDYAFPIMKEFNYVGVACIYPQFINSKNAMSWEQLKELVKAGWSIESHSFSHINLWKVKKNHANCRSIYIREIIHSKKVIEEKLGCIVNFIAWPYGIYTQEAEELAKKAGYIGAFTVEGGANYPGIGLFRLKRQIIYNTDNIDKFLIRLNMKSLPLHNQKPQPGEIVYTSQPQISCIIPSLKEASLGNFKLNVKVSGGNVSFVYNKDIQTLDVKVLNKLKSGQHFVDVYLRDLNSGQTAQHGWMFTVDNR